MWRAVIESAGASGRGCRVTIEGIARAPTVAEVVAAWESDSRFCEWFNGMLAAQPFSGFRWETPSVRAEDGSLGRPFECVVLDDPGLARATADPSAFALQFDTASTAGIAVFRNLGGDATLVVPTPMGDRNSYGHLGAFVRRAPQVQRLALWAAVGRAITARLASSGDRRVWLSTVGAGVPWLHVRLDERPKYYHHSPHRRWTGQSAHRNASLGIATAGSSGAEDVVGGDGPDP